LEREDDEFVVENNSYKIKKNRIPIISKFKDEAAKAPTSPKQEKKPVVTLTRGNKVEKKQPKKFKLEVVGGNKMKLVKK
jgi:hypothetical protein